MTRSTTVRGGSEAPALLKWMTRSQPGVSARTWSRSMAIARWCQASAGRGFVNAGSRRLGSAARVSGSGQRRGSAGAGGAGFGGLVDDGLLLVARQLARGEHIERHLVD